MRTHSSDLNELRTRAGDHGAVSTRNNKTDSVILTRTDLYNGCGTTCGTAGVTRSSPRVLPGFLTHCSVRVCVCVCNVSRVVYESHGESVLSAAITLDHHVRRQVTALYLTVTKH